MDRWRRTVRSRLGLIVAATSLALSIAAPGCDRAVDSTPLAGAGRDTVPVDPETVKARLTEIRRAGDDLERLDALASLVRSVDSQAAPILRLEVVDRSSTWRPFDRLILLSAWARFSGEEATRWAASRAPESYREIALELAMASWARTDPEQARAGFQRDYASDTSAISGLVAGWLETDPEGLAAFVEKIDLSLPTGQHAVAVYVRRRIERDGTTPTVEWAENRGAVWSTPRTKQLYRQVASELTMADPAAGVAFCERHCAGERGAGVRQMVATRWAHRDPVATMDWLVALDEVDPEERQYAVNAGFSNWLQSAPRDALDWAVAQDPALRDESWFEPVVRRVARTLGWKRAEEALAWAESISREAERERVQIFILKRWRARDEAGAEAWMVASPLSDSAKQEVRSAPKAVAGA
jgi:hypothetical protein